MSNSNPKSRKNVSWRVSQHPSSDKLNKWCDQQANIQESISNVILHMIEIYGYRNITDYDIQRSLFNGLNTSNLQSIKVTAPESEIMNEEEDLTIKDNSYMNSEILEINDNDDSKDDIISDQNDDDDDLYNELNLNNL